MLRSLKFDLLKSNLKVRVRCKRSDYFDALLFSRPDIDVALAKSHDKKFFLVPKTLSYFLHALSLSYFGQNILGNIRTNFGRNEKSENGIGFRG